MVVCGSHAGEKYTFIIKLQRAVLHQSSLTINYQIHNTCKNYRVDKNNCECHIYYYPEGLAGPPGLPGQLTGPVR